MREVRTGHRLELGQQTRSVCSTGQVHRFEVALPRFVIEIHHLGDRTETRDDVVTLATDDDGGAAYERSLKAGDADTEELDDGYVRYVFDRIVPNHSYSLKVDPDGSGDLPAYHLFAKVKLPRRGRALEHDGSVDWTGGKVLAPAEELGAMPERSRGGFDLTCGLPVETDDEDDA